MEITTENIKRVFKMKKGNDPLILDDPNPEFSPEEVLSLYSNTYPELTNATLSKPDIKDGEVIYEFKTTIGTKG